jgi:hypothetical protein
MLGHLKPQKLFAWPIKAAKIVCIAVLKLQNYAWPFKAAKTIYLDFYKLQQLFALSFKAAKIMCLKLRCQKPAETPR